MVWSATSASSTMPKPHKHGRAGAFCRSGFRLPAAEGAGPASRAAQQAATGAAAGLTVPAVSGLRAPQRRCTGNAAASFITRVIRASATDRQARLARRHESSDERLSLSAVVAGFIATVISYAGPLVIIFRAAKAANLPHDVLSSRYGPSPSVAACSAFCSACATGFPSSSPGRHRARRCW